jgi:hypothetical protein
MVFSTVRYLNRSASSYMHVPRHATTTTFDTFRRIMPNGKVIKLASLVGGGMKNVGLKLLSRKFDLLRKVDRVNFIKMTPEASLALQFARGMTG